MFSRTRAAVGRARQFVGNAIADHVPDERAEDILLCASELATNALQHTPPGRMFRVCLTLASDALRLEVHDAGNGTPHVREAGEGDGGGRGLLLVSALADEWGTARRAGPGKCVWATFPFPSAAELLQSSRSNMASLSTAAPWGVRRLALYSDVTQVPYVRTDMDPDSQSTRYFDANGNRIDMGGHGTGTSTANQTATSADGGGPNPPPPADTDLTSDSDSD
ncbi:putative ATP-grasp-modified RiPP [Streptomyces sp. B-S-A8]|uniref:ATP-grasp-modified RiPP n=1 Tax=Streptomyces solicavernae TaxID=3043614 RepID=A0ABT6RRX5_9ACTN|nr:ATP-binding protein [Streptomyces sp. B-S-A8]MDI3386483.1 putative ATP-grasp-modified RiPP [Streptomyces sp. B-S-A8]